jgi:hypothetical protein
VFKGRAYAPSIGAVGCPRATIVRFFVCDNSSAWGCKGASVEVMIAKDSRIGRQFWIESGGPKEIQGHCCLWKEAIPFEGRVFRIGGTQACNEMGLKGLDSPFSCVTPMNMGRNKLVLDFIFEEAVLQVVRGFIVENVEFGAMARADQDVKKLGQGGVDFSGSSCFNCCGKDGIAVIIVAN